MTKRWLFYKTLKFLHLLIIIILRDLVLVKGVSYQIVLDFVPGLFSIVHRSSGGTDSLSAQNGFHLRSPKKAILFNAYSYYSTSCICSFLQFMMLKIFVRMDLAIIGKTNSFSAFPPPASYLASKVTFWEKSDLEYNAYINQERYLEKGSPQKQPERLNKSRWNREVLIFFTGFGVHGRI